MTTHWIRLLGSILIAFGSAVLVIGSLGFILFQLWTMIQNHMWWETVASVGFGSIVIGWGLRKIFREPPQKI